LEGGAIQQHPPTLDQPYHDRPKVFPGRGIFFQSRSGASAIQSADQRFALERTRRGPPDGATRADGSAG